jgi:hypothetical protein
MVVAGLLVLPFSFKLEKSVPANPTPTPTKPSPTPRPQGTGKVDPRTVRLKGFFSRLHCPVLDLAEEFVHAADDNRLDWRLLPSISVIESGGGKAFRNNNILGWGNGVQLFPTIRSGIHEVAFKLGKSPLYKNRDSVGKLLIYNPNEDYARQVVDVMNKISPVVNLEPARRPVIRQTQIAYVQN